MSRKIEKVASDIEKWVVAVVKAAAVSGIIGLFLMALVTTYGVLMRYAFRAPIRWGMELCELLLIISIFALAANTLREKVHIRADILIQRLPTKLRNLSNVSAFGMGILYTSLLLWATILYVSYLRQHQVRTDDMWIVVWPIILPVVIGALLFVLQFIIEFVKSLKALKRS